MRESSERRKKSFISVNVKEKKSILILIIFSFIFFFPSFHYTHSTDTDTQHKVFRVEWYDGTTVTHIRNEGSLSCTGGRRGGEMTISWKVQWKNKFIFILIKTKWETNNTHISFERHKFFMIRFETTHLRSPFYLPATFYLFQSSDWNWIGNPVEFPSNSELNSLPFRV